VRGGLSTLRDGRAVKEQLEETPDGRVALRVLTDTKLPVRIPRRSGRSTGSPPRMGTAMYRSLPTSPCGGGGRTRLNKDWSLILNARPRGPHSARHRCRRPGELPWGPEAAADRRNRHHRQHVAFHGRTAFTDSSVIYCESDSKSPPPRQRRVVNDRPHAVAHDTERYSTKSTHS